MADDDFRQQQRSFQVNGYARNPNLAGVDAFSGAALPFVGNVHAAYLNGGATVAEQVVTKKQTREMKRKRKAKGELGVFDEEPVEGEERDPNAPREYKGPWAGWDEHEVDAAVYEGPDEEEYEVARRTKRPLIEKSKRDVGFGEEKSVFHGASAPWLRDDRSLLIPHAQARICSTTRDERTCTFRATSTSTSNPKSQGSSSASSRKSASTPGPGIQEASRLFVPSRRAVIYCSAPAWTPASRCVRSSSLYALVG